MLLFGDASPTLVFGLLTGSPTEITLIRTKHLALGDSDGAPSGIESIAEPRVRREVSLRHVSCDGRPRDALHRSGALAA